MDNEILKTDTETEKNNTNSNNEVSSEKTENKKNAENDSVSSDNGEKKKKGVGKENKKKKRKLFLNFRKKSTKKNSENKQNEELKNSSTKEKKGFFAKFKRKKGEKDKASKKEKKKIKPKKPANPKKKILVVLTSLSVIAIIFAIGFFTGVFDKFINFSSYSNQNIGFKVFIPKSWKGKYKVFNYVNGPDEGISFVAILPSEADDLSNDTSNANISFAEDDKKTYDPKKTQRHDGKTRRDKDNNPIPSTNPIYEQGETINENSNTPKQSRVLFTVYRIVGDMISPDDFENTADNEVYLFKNSGYTYVFKYPKSAIRRGLDDTYPELLQEVGNIIKSVKPISTEPPKSKYLHYNIHGNAYFNFILPEQYMVEQHPELPIHYNILGPDKEKIGYIALTNYNDDKYENLLKHQYPVYYASNKDYHKKAKITINDKHMGKFERELVANNIKFRDSGISYIDFIEEFHKLKAQGYKSYIGKITSLEDPLEIQKKKELNENQAKNKKNTKNKKKTKDKKQKDKNTENKPTLQAKDLINEYNKSVNAKKRKNNKPSDENKNEVENIRTVVDEKPPVEVKFTLALMNKTFDSSIEELKKTFDEKNQLTFKSLDNILVLPINKGTGYYSKYGAVKLRQLITSINLLSKLNKAFPTEDRIFEVMVNDKNEVISILELE